VALMIGKSGRGATTIIDWVLVKARRELLKKGKTVRRRTGIAGLGPGLSMADRDAPRRGNCPREMASWQSNAWKRIDACSGRGISPKTLGDISRPEARSPVLAWDQEKGGEGPERRSWRIISEAGKGGR